MHKSISGVRGSFYPSHLMFFAVLLTAGGDLLSVDIFNLTFRLVALLALFGIVIAAASSHEIQTNKVLAYPLLSLTFFSILSLVNSYDSLRTISYTLWIIFITVVIIPYIYTVSRRLDQQKVLLYWLTANRVQAILLITELIIRVLAGNFNFNERPHLWFYEPSYAAIYFSAYFSFSLYVFVSRNKGTLFDLSLALFTLLALASATAILSIVISAAVVLVVTRKTRWLVLGLLLSPLVVTTITLFQTDHFLYQLMFGFLADSSTDISDIFARFLDRTGNRPARFVSGLEAFIAHPWLGVGFGADNIYNSTHILNANYVSEFEWGDRDISNNPFVNPFIEILGTMGLFGGISFMALVISLYGYLRSRFRSADLLVKEKALIVGLLTMFIMIQFEGTILRFYIWVLVGLVVGIASRSKPSWART